MITIKARIFTLVLLTLVNLLVAPVGLYFFYLIAQSGITVATETVKTTLMQNPLWGISLMFNPNIWSPWLWLQIPFGVITLLIIVGFFKKGKLGYRERSPYEIQSAGRGEHGTARWRTHKELRRTMGGINSPKGCLLYTSPSPRDGATSRMPSSA